MFNIYKSIQQKENKTMEHSYIHFKIDKELKTELQIIALKQNTNINIFIILPIFLLNIIIFFS